MLEALCAYGYNRSHPAIEKGVQYLIRTQEEDGSWYGRWGVDYVYGTFLALRGLAAAGVSDREAYVQRGLEWVRSIQNFDGGWGESCESYQQQELRGRAEHSFTDRVGRAGAAGRRRYHQHQPARRYRILDSDPEKRWNLG